MSTYEWRVFKPDLRTAKEYIRLRGEGSAPMGADKSWIDWYLLTNDIELNIKLRQNGVLKIRKVITESSEGIYGFTDLYKEFLPIDETSWHQFVGYSNLTIDTPQSFPVSLPQLMKMIDQSDIRSFEVRKSVEKIYLSDQKVVAELATAEFCNLGKIIETIGLESNDPDSIRQIISDTIFAQKMHSSDVKDYMSAIRFYCSDS